MHFSARKHEYLVVYMRKEWDIGAGRVHEEQEMLLMEENLWNFIKLMKDEKLMKVKKLDKLVKLYETCER